MRVAVLCEYSGIVRDAFITQGHIAVSCDILPTESEGPHIQGNLFDYDWSECDLIIAHPPCTYIAVSGNRYYAGTEKRKKAAEFIRMIWDIPVDKMCIENPVGQINKYLPFMPKPQYIQPWQFGHGETKKTGLWKRGLPDLMPTNIVEGREQRIWKMPPSKDRGKIRSRFYEGIAEAMAIQWGT
jgi:site-specific DNA-cytosine methylase